MTKLEFSSIYSGSRWMDNVRVTLDKDGIITEISQLTDAAMKKAKLLGYAVPGVLNAHSHAFHIAMAGSAENIARQSGADDFWSWREQMYKLALLLNPEEMRTVCTYAYCKMLEAGYTEVSEFHYVFHDENGKPYKNAFAMTDAVVEAAEIAGIRLNLVPVLYSTGSINSPPNERQRRFIYKSTDEYLKFVSDAKKRYKKVRLSAGVHSIRAATKVQITEVSSFCEERGWEFHMHIAEQMLEVNMCREHYRTTPVDWITKNFNVSPLWHLVHSTHVTDDELSQIAKTKATVVLCPTTEANLGDGLFPARAYINGKNRWLIGSDSHITVSPWRELNTLDYGQRLKFMKRNVLCPPGHDSGTSLFNELIAHQELSPLLKTRSLTVGQPFDASVFPGNDPFLSTEQARHRLSSIVYGPSMNGPDAVYSRGKLLVEDGKHLEVRDCTKGLAQVRRRCLA
jgi:formimidoylglutamate deiminase